MTSSCSDSLLSTLVESIRQACEQHITFKDFTSVSGLICFDIDGFKQQCFVISELLQKRSVGEGHSSHLKTLNWKGIERNETEILHAPRNSCSKPIHVDESNCRRLSDGQTELRKSLSGPQDTFAILQTKLDWCNRTFTLKPREQCEIEPSSNIPLEKKSTTTATVSKEGALKVKQENSQSGHKKCVLHGTAREINICEKRWPKDYNTGSSKANTHYRNCYPGLPKKPMKRCKPLYNKNKSERQITKYSNDSNSEPLKDVDHPDYLKHTKMRYNSPSEKPTTLSWFETVISPSSSFESIDSIQPFYLVPHSEPLSNSPYYRSEAKTICEYSSHSHHQSAVQSSEYNDFAENATDPVLNISTTTPRHFKKDGRQDQHVTATLFKQESPLKTTAAHSTTSSGTLHTISSIEHDAITVKESNPQNSTWKAVDRALKTPRLPAGHIETQNLSEYSAFSKKRASLMKWMGLFKKGSKTSSNGVSAMQKHGTKLKPGKNILEPPIEIRLKQWN